MWDDRRKVGVLNDFDLAKFGDQTGASGQDNTGTLPFMALDLLSERGLHGEIPRRYRHEAESFTWSLICLYFATAEDEGGENRTRNPHPLHRWFADWESSLDAKIALRWHDHNISGVRLAHPNTRNLARALYKHWLDRYREQFPVSESGTGRGPQVERLFGRGVPNPPEAPQPYQEPDDDTVFEDVLTLHELPLDLVPLKGVQDDLIRMVKEYQCVDWST